MGVLNAPMLRDSPGRLLTLASALIMLERRNRKCFEFIGIKSGDEEDLTNM